MGEATRAAIASGEKWPMPPREAPLGMARMGLVLTGGDSAIVEAALDAATALGTTLSGCFLSEAMEGYAYAGFDGVGAIGMSTAIETARLRNADAYNTVVGAFDAAAHRRGLAVGDVDGRPFVQWLGEIETGEALGRRSRLLDLIVLAQPKGHATLTRSVALDALLYRARRSVLLLPETTGALIFDHIMIAFNGSAEATRAVSSALAVLRRARDVTVVCVGQPEEDAPSPQDLVAYLKSHGVTSHAVEATAKGPIEPTLIGAAADCNADLIVMGAYTHSHLRHMVLGGVTSYMISRGTLPVLLAH